MKVLLSKPIIGLKKISETDVETRVHADAGDVLPVILHNTTHYICDSKYYPGLTIVVFPSQCEEIIPEVDIEDSHDLEKYYHVYEDCNKQNLEDDPFYTALLGGDDEVVLEGC